jgi:hypothetical protein
MRQGKLPVGVRLYIEDIIARLIVNDTGAIRRRSVIGATAAAAAALAPRICRLAEDDISKRRRAVMGDF